MSEHKPTDVQGYRALTPAEIELINKVKQLEQAAGDLVKELRGVDGIDYRAVSVGVTNLEQGCMWLTKSIGRAASPFA